MKARLIQAFFNGTCRCCGKKVPKGQPAWFAKHYGVRCPSCGPHSSSDAPLPGKRKAGSRPSAAPSPTVPTMPAAEPEPFRGSGFTPMYAPAGLRGNAIKGPDGVARLAWSSVTELVHDAFADYAQNQDARTYLRDLHTRRAESSWANGHTPDSLRQATHEPAADLLTAIEALRAELVDELAIPTATRRKIRRGQDWGDELDADRFLNREPSAWERSERESCPRRTVTIGVNLTVSWAQAPAELLYRGAAAVVLADLLTQRGINVRIVGFSVGEEVSSSVAKLVSIAELKGADMPLDIASIATAVCDVGFFRMVVMPAEFRHLSGKVSHGLGIRGHQYLPGPDRMSLDYLVESRVTTREAAMAWLREQTAALPAKEVCHV